MWYVYIMEYYAAIKINEILTHATTQKNVGNIMLSEINQTRNDNIV